VSSHPGETKDISGYKVASHPNIYVLDTPGVLSPVFFNDESGPLLALTGAIKDSMMQEFEIAQFLLAILNSRETYKKWENMNQAGDMPSFSHAMSSSSHHNKRQYASDHTQDFVVKAVRQVLFDSISSFKGYLENENELKSLIECQFIALQEAFRVSADLSEDVRKLVAMKLLNLYRTGRLGRYTLDCAPDVRKEIVS
jgi:ribosome biogenesis GTPase A